MLSSDNGGKNISFLVPVNHPYPLHRKNHRIEYRLLYNQEFLSKALDDCSFTIYLQSIVSTLARGSENRPRDNIVFALSEKKIRFDWH